MCGKQATNIEPAQQLDCLQLSGGPPSLNSLGCLDRPDSIFYGYSTGTPHVTSPLTSQGLNVRTSLFVSSSKTS